MAGACLDPIIPPSVLAVVIATIANVSPGRMLIAGILPGLLLMSMFLVYVLARVWLTPSLAPDSLADIQDRNREGSKTVAVLRMLPCAFVFFMVMGLIMFGVATPTEAAATGVFGAIAVSLYYGGLSRQMIWEAAQSAATIIVPAARDHVQRRDVQSVDDLHGRRKRARRARRRDGTGRRRSCCWSCWRCRSYCSCSWIRWRSC